MKITGTIVFLLGIVLCIYAAVPFGAASNSSTAAGTPDPYLPLAVGCVSMAVGGAILLFGGAGFTSTRPAFLRAFRRTPQ